MPRHQEREPHVSAAYRRGDLRHASRDMLRITSVNSAVVARAACTHHRTNMSTHNLMVGIGRICPPIARLHDHRNALLVATAALEREVLTLTTERDHLAAEIEHARKNGGGAGRTIEAELV